MSTEIDERVVEMKFNNKNFEKNVSTSMNTLQRFKESLDFKGATKGIEKLNKEAKTFSLEPILNAVEEVDLKFSAMSIAAISAISRIVSRATDAGIDLVKSLSVDNIAAGWEKFSEKTVSVGTLAAQGYDLSAVEAQLKRLNWYTDETSYNFTDMVNNIAKFTATGKDLNESVTALEGIANWAALSGQNAAVASRAMYQLSQAMGAGVMRKEDWKSIQNVSMDTDEFRQKALDAGVALGTLKKNTDGTYQSLINNSKKFTKAQFTEHLTQDAWFTDKVMMKVYQDYAAAVDQIYGYATIKGITASEAMEELGDDLDAFAVKAFKAAQEARTWGDVVGSVKDAVSTGWMNTFELIFGNYDEATKLFTDLANSLYDVFAEGGNRRNEVLAEGLMTGWKQLLNEGIPDAEKFKDVIFEIGKATGQLDDEKIQAIREDFEGSLKDGWLTADLLSAGILKITQDFRALSKEELKTKGYTEAEISALQVLNENFLTGALSVEDYADQMARMSGRENLVEAFWNLYNALFAVDEESGEALGIISAFKEAVAEIFPPLTGDRIYAITERIKAFSERLIPTAETLDRLKSIFKGLASVVDIFGQVLSAIWRSLKPVFDLLKIGADRAFDFSASISDTITAFAKTAKETDLFYNKIQSIIQVVSNAIQKVKDFTITILEFLGIKSKDSDKLFSGITASIEKASGIFGAFRKAAAKVIEVIQNVKTKVTEGVGSITIDLSKPLGILQLLWNIASSLLNGLFTVIGNILGLVNDLFQALNPLGFKELISLIISAVTAINIKWLTDTVTSVTDVLWTLQNNIKADTVMKIAKALLILTASIAILSLLDSDKLYAAVGVMALLMTELTTMMRALAGMLNNITSLKTAILGFAQMARFTTLMIAFKQMAVGLLIAAGALAIIGKMSWGEIARGVLGLGTVMLMLFTLFKAISKLQGYTTNATKILKSLIPFGLALILVSAAMRNISKMSWDELARSLVGIFGVIEIVLILCKYLEQLGKGGTKNAISIIKQLIPFALAMLLVSAAMRNVAKMSWEEIGKSLVGFFGVIGIILILCKQIQGIQGGIDNSVAIMKRLIPFSLAMLLVSAAMRNMAKLGWEEIGRALLGFGGVILILLVICERIQMIASGVNSSIAVLKQMIPLALAMILVSAAMRNMANLGWEEIIRSAVAFGLVLAEITAALAILSSGKGINSGKLVAAAGAIGIISVAMVALAVALRVIGSLPIPAMVASVLTIAVALAAVVAAAYLAEPVIAPMLALAGAFLAIGIAAIGVGAGFALLTTGLATLVAIGPSAITVVDQFLLGFISLGPRLAEAMLVAMTGMLSAINTLLPQLMQTFTNLMDMLLQVAINELPKLEMIVRRALETILSILVESTPKILKAVTDVLTSILSSVIDFVPVMIDSGVQIIVAILHGIRDAIPQIMLAAVEVIMAFLEGIAESEIYMIAKAFEIAINFINGLADTIRENKDLMKDAVDNLVDAIFGDFNARWEEFKETAQHLIDGFIEGIDAKVDEAVEAAKRLGSQVLGGLRSFFKIASPSKVMRDEVGRYVVEGIAEGIEKNMSAEDAAKKKAENIVKIFKEYIDKIDTEVNGLKLEFELWDVTNVHKTKKQRLDKQLETMAKQLEFAEKKLGAEEAKFKTVAHEFAEDTNEYIEASNNLSQARIDFVNVRNSYYEALASVQIPETELNDAGSLIIRGLAYGISSDMTAEEVAAQKAENIVNAFQKVYDKLDVSDSIRSLQSDIWELANPDAKKKELMIHSILKLQEDIKTQAQRVNYAEAEWKALVDDETATEDERTAAYQRYLEELRAGVELEASLESLRKNNKSTFSSAMAQIETMTDEEIASYLGIPKDNSIVKAFEKVRDEMGRISETIFEGNGPFSDITNSNALQAILDSIEVQFKEDLPKALSGSGNWTGVPEEAGSAMGSAWAEAFDANYIQAIYNYVYGGQANVAQAIMGSAQSVLAGAFSSGKIDQETMNRLSAILSILQNKINEELAKLADDATTAGTDLGLGLFEGLVKPESVNAVKTGALKVGDELLDTITGKKGLDENSPSKKAAKIGEYFVIGLCDGIKSMADEVASTAELIGDNIVSPVGGIVTRIDNILKTNLDFEPVISPVLDLTDIESNAYRLQSILDTGTAYRLATDTMKIETQNAQLHGNDVVVAQLTRKLDSLVYGLDDLRDIVNAQNNRDLNVEVNVDGSTLATATVQDFIAASRANGTPFFSKH